MCAARLAAHVPNVPTRPLAIAATVWCGVAAVLLVAGLWLLLAGSLNAHRRDGKPLSGVALAGCITLVAAGWPLFLLGCTAGSVRTRLRCSTRRLVAAGRDAAVTTDHETQHHLERTVQAMNSPPRGLVDHGVPQTAPFRVGQRIRNTHAWPRRRHRRPGTRCRRPPRPRPRRPVVGDRRRIRPALHAARARRSGPGGPHLDLERPRRPLRPVPRSSHLTAA